MAARFGLGMIGEYLAEAILPHYLGCELEARTDVFRDDKDRLNYDYDVIFRDAHRFGGDIIYGLDAKVKSHPHFHPNIDGVRILAIDQFKYHDYMGIVNDEGRDNIKFYFLFLDRSTLDVYLIDGVPDYTNVHITESEFNAHGKNKECMFVGWDVDKHSPIITLDSKWRKTIGEMAKCYDNGTATKDMMRRYVTRVYNDSI